MSGDLRGAEDLNHGEIEVAPEVSYLTHKYTNMEDDLLETTTRLYKMSIECTISTSSETMNSVEHE